MSHSVLTGRPWPPVETTTQLHIWEAKTGKSLAVLKGHEDSVRAVAFGHEGRTLVTGSADKTLRVWELAK